MIKKAALAAGADDAVVCSHWAQGGAGAANLADSVIKACNKPSNFKFLYDLNISLEDKIKTVAREMYGAGNIEYAPKVLKIMEQYKKQVDV